MPTAEYIAVVRDKDIVTHVYACHACVQEMSKKHAKQFRPLRRCELVLSVRCMFCTYNPATRAREPATHDRGRRYMR